jgi:GT2 family glycosyltransferase
MAVGLLEERPDIGSVGCKVGLPESPGWIEAVWHELHFPNADRLVDYINSGNLVVRRAAFVEVGGFTPRLTSGEDAELGQKLRMAGWKNFESTKLEVAHLRNPQNLKQFWRRESWHAQGMLGTVSWREIDKPTALLFAHVLLLAVGALLLASGVQRADIRLLLGGLAVAFISPVLAVTYRSIRKRSLRVPWLRGVFLYQVYLLARLRVLINLGWSRLLR